MKKRLIDAKEPFPLYRLVEGDYVESGVWACGECGQLTTLKDITGNCCQAPKCLVCNDYVTESWWTTCKPCRDKQAAEKEQAAWEKMPIVEYNGEPLWDVDRYFYNDEEALDYYSGAVDRPEYLEVCERRTIGDEISVDSILDYVCEHMLENVEDASDEHVVGTEELSAALEKFMRAQTLETWRPIGKKIKVVYNEE